jgi:hypothetical protein
MILLRNCWSIAAAPGWAPPWPNTQGWTPDNQNVGEFDKPRSAGVQQQPTTKKGPRLVAVPVRRSRQWRPSQAQRQLRLRLRPAVGNSSIWLYNSRAARSGRPASSANHFGGFHNNYVDKHATTRPSGLRDDALGGRRFFKNVLEFNARPFR